MSQKYNLYLHNQNQTTQAKLTKKTKYNHGGALRNIRAGRGARPLSTKESLNVVLKIDKKKLRSKSLRSSRPFLLTQKLIRKYSMKFYVRIDQISIQNDHIHLLIRTTRRSLFHHFFRVVSGQIAQVFLKEGLIVKVTDTPNEPTGLEKPGTGLWLYRPFSRVVKGWRAYQTAVHYIWMNELEVTNQIPYSKQRLRGLSESDWSKLLNFKSRYATLLTLSEYRH